VVTALRSLLDRRQDHRRHLLGDAEVGRGARQRGDTLAKESHREGGEILACRDDRVDHVDRHGFLGAERFTLQDDRQGGVAAHRIAGVHETGAAR
jgi:hypothetical protein